MRDLVQQSPAEFISFLKKSGIRRFFIITDPRTGEIRASHPALEPLARHCSADKRDFAGHEGIFVQVTRKHDVLLGAFVHRTTRGQAQGGTRFWDYDTVGGFLSDGQRLSKGMTHKNALAGLWWGGGKGVMARNPAVDSRDPAIRAEIFREYGEFTTSLRGVYVTAEDVGTQTEDMLNIFSRTRFTTCIPENVGGSGNPSRATAAGTVRGLEAALRFLDGGDLQGRRIAVQGTGNVGEHLVRFLLERKVRSIVACDIDAGRLEALRSMFPGAPLEARLVDRKDLAFLGVDCDVLAPCATGAILNPSTIPAIKARVVCGAANNQLEDPERDGLALFERKIHYVPDFLVNRMGIVHCANEQYGYVERDPLVERHFDEKWEYSIYNLTLRVLELARESGEPPARAAGRLAEEFSQDRHPLFGHRGQLIIDSLVSGAWANQS
jgi:glutamate dehydrogenase/leucine dehydrogenase